jgi:tRNA/tmRNA/rRNA uracil-C5-methylase (TrmA/RlmC/RlmD family)
MLTKQYKFYEPIAPYITLSYHDQILTRDTLLNKSLNQLLVNSVNNTVKSPLIRNFRNKNRFVIGTENDKPVIGYKYGIKSKNIFCLTQIPDEDLIYPRIEIKQFIREHLNYLKKSQLKPFDKSKHNGFWKFITFRYSEYENAYSIQYTIELRYTDKIDVDLEIEKVITFCNNSYLNIKSISFKDCYDKEYSINHEIKPLIEKLDNYLFKIYPNAFFQTNIRIASKLYQKVRDIVRSYSSEKNNIQLYDLCTGTGTIAIYCSDIVKSVIAIDVCKDAIINAKDNMKLNNINNIDFINCDIGKYDFNKINKTNKLIATIDPIRSGVNKNVLKCINEIFDVVIYVSCNINSFIRDMEFLTNFKLISTYPYDMFPHTNYYETVNVCVRTEQ